MSIGIAGGGHLGGLAEGCPGVPARARSRCGPVTRPTRASRAVAENLLMDQFCARVVRPGEPDGTAFMNDSSASIPRHLADFELVRRLGAGGMAEVFLAKRR